MKQIQLSDHFTFRRLIRFVIPCVVMMIFTSIYSVVDGVFVSNFVGKIPFAVINLILPFVMILGSFGFMFGTGGSALIARIVAEKPNLGLKCTIIAGVTNIVLDAGFIVFFKWGVAAAALATGIGYGVGALIPVFYFLESKDSIIKFAKTKLELSPILKAAANGSSEFISNISTSSISVLFNLKLMQIAGENGVATYGVLMYVQFVFAAIFIGYSIGTAPIFSFNYGASNQDELKNMFKKSIAAMLGLGICLTIFVNIFGGTLVKLFVGYDAELMKTTVHAVAIFSLAFILSGYNMFASAFLPRWIMV